MLSIDDAFAGGVCRCQYCGTIQTVPKATQAADVTSPKALFKRKARIESALSPYNDDLDRAADQMDSSGPLSPNALAGLSAPPKRASAPASSDTGVGSPVGASQAGIPSPRRSSPAGSTAGGIASATVAHQAATATAPEPSRPGGKPHYVPKPSGAAAAQAGKSNKTPLIIAAAAIGVAVCGGGLWLALSGGSKPAPAPKPEPAHVTPDPKPAQTNGKEPAPVAAPAVAVAAEPAPAPVAPAPVPVGEPGSLAGISLAGANVVYILDRANCTPEAFQRVLDATYSSIHSLGQGRKFAVMVWNNQVDLAFPQQDLVAATATNVEECRKAMAETNAGVTDIGLIVTRAVTAQAEDVVLMSATDLDDLAAMSIRDQLAKSAAPVRFHGLALGSEASAIRLKLLVADFNGQLKQVDPAALK